MTVGNTDGWFLRSERLGFRPWREDDGDLALALWGDLQVTRRVGGPFSPEQVAQKLAREIANQREHGYQYWPMFRLAGGAFVGACGFRPRPSEPGALEHGFYLVPAFWGGGYAAEAGRAVIGHAFSALGARSVFAGHHPDNAPSRRVLEKLGFEYVHDELYPPTGLMHPGYRLTEARYRSLAAS